MLKNPISASVLFMVHCTTGSASPISDSMRSSSPGGSSPSGLFTTRSAVRLHPARAAQRSSRGHPCLAKRLLVGVLFDDIGDEPVRHVRKGDRPHHSIHFFGRHVLWLDQEGCQELGIGVAGLPKRHGEHYDVLRGLEYLRCAGVQPDERVSDAIDLVTSKRGADGRWPLETQYPGKMPVETDGGEGRPSRWNTLRALRVLDRRTQAGGRSERPPPRLAAPVGKW